MPLYQRSVLILLLLTPSILAQTNWTTGADVPDPISKQGECGNTAPGFVCNPDSVISAEEVTQINDLVKTIISESNCNCPNDCPEDRNGFVISVLAISALSDLPSTNSQTQNESRLHDFTHAARAAWKLGECDNDALLLVATDQKKVWTNTGKNTKIFLSDTCVGNIFTKYKDIFKQKVSYGIVGILNEYRTSLKNGYCSVFIYKPDNNKDETSDDEEDSSGLSGGAMAGIFVACMVLMVLLVVALVFVVKKCDQMKGRDWRARGGGRSSNHYGRGYGHGYYDDHPYSSGGGGGSSSGGGGGGGGGGDDCGGGGGSYD